MPTVLLVENDSLCRADITEILEEHGFVVEGFATGGEAFERLEARERNPDVILLDLFTPGIDGKGFRRLQSGHPRLCNIPVILMSGAPDLDREARQMQVAGRLHKPFNLDALLTLLQRLAG